MKKSTVHIIDNFLPNPMQLRDLALTKSFVKNNNSPFSCMKQPANSLISEDLTKRILKIIDRGKDNTLLGCEFSLYSKEDEKINRKNGIWIHSDRCSSIGLLFLNPKLPYNKSGLAFYRHKKTEIYRWEQAQSNIEAQKQLATDSANDKLWEELYYIENIFNRIVIFDSRIFHQAKSYFGNSEKDSRLTLNIYFT